MKKKIVHVIVHNHFDPIWRRGWVRNFEFRGKKIRCYAELEEIIIKEWVTLAERDGICFTEGQAAVFREFIRRNPSYLPRLQKLQKQGKFIVVGAGEVIPDTNIPAGETLVRNYLYGLLWWKETFNVTPRLAWVADAFGTSAQLPQIFRSMNMHWILGLSYQYVKSDFWRGLDGTVIYSKSDFPIAYATNNFKYPPCSACNGYGCKQCNFTGLALNAYRIPSHFIQDKMQLDLSNHQYGIILVGGEEALTNQQLYPIFRKEAHKFKDRKFMFNCRLLQYHRSDLDQIDNPPESRVSKEVEGNPTSSGCLVTRIKLKQLNRKTENEIIKTEKLATLTNMLGKKYPGTELKSAWQKLCFLQFHDAITATHINAAYYELLDYYQEINDTLNKIKTDSLTYLTTLIKRQDNEKQVLIFNPHSWSVSEFVDFNGIGKVWVDNVPPMGFKIFSISKLLNQKLTDTLRIGKKGIENQFYKLKFDRFGITKIYDKQNKTGFTDGTNLRVNELVLEDDVGDPWGTTEKPGYAIPLHPYTRFKEIQKTTTELKLVYTGTYTNKTKKIFKLQWEQQVTLSRITERIDFDTKIGWDTRGVRLKLAFPFKTKSNAAYYEIPYGNLNRERYAGTFAKYNMPNGDWPTQNWLAVKFNSNYHIAIFNQGLPAARVEDGVAYISVLRSPEQEYCLNEPEFYNCPDYTTMYDIGEHQFRYALQPFANDTGFINTIRTGAEFNCPLELFINPMSPPILGGEKEEVKLPQSISYFSVGNGLQITTLKPAELQPDKWILRIFNSTNQKQKLDLETFLKFKLVPVNLLEEPLPADKSNDIFRPFELKTFLLEQKI